MRYYHKNIFQNLWRINNMTDLSINQFKKEYIFRFQKKLLTDLDIWSFGVDVAITYFITHSELFDVHWYLNQYPDVAESNIDPIMHYVKYGAFEERNPNQWFSTEEYLKNNPIVKQNRINPFFHFLSGEAFNNIKDRIIFFETNDTYNYKTYNDITKEIKLNIYKFINIDLFVGIPRSGMIPATILSLFLNKNLCTLTEFINNNIMIHGYRSKATTDFKNILIVDDSITTGRAILDAKNLIKQNLDTSKKSIKYFAAYATEESRDKVDYFLNIVDHPRFFEWNYLNHAHCQNWAYDLDGVLCLDPTEEENDDGQKYLNFIRTAKPLYIPDYKIGAIITARLEKYRYETEIWLKKNRVIYSNLYMLNLPSKEDRIRLNAHTNIKIYYYNKLTHLKLFLESEPIQAKLIAQKTGKKVICTKNNILY